MSPQTRTRLWVTAIPVGVLLTCLAPEPVGAADFPSQLPLTAKQYNERGEVLAAKAKWQDAIDAFSEAIELSPKRSEIYVNRAIAFQKLGQWSKAEADCTTAIKYNFEDTRAFLQRAVARSEQGNRGGAFQDASRAARMEPDNAQCVFIRYLTASRLGRFDLGHTAGETYIGLKGWNDPASPFMALLNYLALRQSGEPKAADAILAEAAANIPANVWPAPVIHYLRGDLDANTLLSLATDQGRETLARYYIGMQEWLGGKVADAGEQFRWIAAHGDPAYLQFKLAGDQLGKLKLAGDANSAASKE